MAVIDDTPVDVPAMWTARPSAPESVDAEVEVPANGPGETLRTADAVDTDVEVLAICTGRCSVAVSDEVETEVPATPTGSERGAVIEDTVVDVPASETVGWPDDCAWSSSHHCPNHACPR